MGLSHSTVAHELMCVPYAFVHLSALLFLVSIGHFSWFSTRYIVFFFVGYLLNLLLLMCAGVLMGLCVCKMCFDTSVTELSRLAILTYGFENHITVCCVIVFNTTHTGHNG